MTTKLTCLVKDIPPKEIVEALDSILFDYAIICIKDHQNTDTDKAIEYMRIVKRLRDDVATELETTLYL